MNDPLVIRKHRLSIRDVISEHLHYIGKHVNLTGWIRKQLERFEEIQIKEENHTKDWRKDAKLRTRLQDVVDSEFKRITYTEVIDLLKKVVVEDQDIFEESDIVWGDGYGIRTREVSV